jgi:hypothetical protein
MPVRNPEQMDKAGFEDGAMICQLVHFQLEGVEVAQYGQMSRSSLLASLLILKARCTGLRQQMPGVHRALAGILFPLAKSIPRRY